MSHFTMLVIGDDIENQLTPFDEATFTENEKIRQFQHSPSLIMVNGTKKEVWGGGVLLQMKKMNWNGLKNLIK